MLELKMYGIDSDKLSPMERSLLLSHIEDKKDMRYLETQMIIGAILHAATVIAGGKPGDALTKNLKLYKNLMFPEHAIDLEESARKVKSVLEEEFKRGPMKVKSLEYGGRKNRKKKQRP